MKRELLLFISFVFLISIGNFECLAQKDSLEIKIPKERPAEMSSPMRAALLAAVLPGSGQVYNKKYWKVPIVYAGVAGFAYSIKFNHDNYVEFRNALQINTDEDPNTVNSFPLNTFDNSALKRIRDAYRRYRDLSIILSIVFYGITIADAVVDAHLADFDVSPDLSARITPTLIPAVNDRRQGAVWGLSLQLTF